MAPVSYLLLPMFILINLHSPATSTYHGNTTAPLGHPDQAEALLKLKQSFIFDYSSTTLTSWHAGTDCCFWEGVGCDSVFGHITVLDISGRGLYSYNLDQVLFNLTTLHRLDLSMNDFGGSRIPTVGFERLSALTHLNLSYSGFHGQIPESISKLKNLVSLDLSSFHVTEDPETINYAATGHYNSLALQDPSFERLVANLANLKELYLDGVDISSSGEDWSRALGKSVPCLQVLSMESCSLQGRIHSSLSTLSSLTMINLRRNFGISGVVPEFFADFQNLSSLQLNDNSFVGWFPQRIFALKNLKVLDVSYNYELSGQLTELSDASSLETLNIMSTSFSDVKLSSISSSIFLMKLGLDGRAITMEPPHLYVNKFKSLQNLELSFFGFTWELGNSFSWFGNLKRLTSLALSECNIEIMSPWLDNLTNLKRMEISFCSFSGTIPPSFTKLKNLTALKISACASGTIPSSIGNLRKLRSLEISYSNNMSGPIPSAIGYLRKLKVLVLAGCHFSGAIPSTIINLTRLNYLDISENDLTGTVPDYLFTFPELKQLHLYSNNLFGPIHEFDPVPLSLQVVRLGENKLTGQVPTSLFQLTSLVDLDLESNNLTGLIQLTSFWRQRRLSILNLSNNKLIVKDDKSNSTFPLLPAIEAIWLASCGMTEIPSFLMHLAYVNVLDISCNQIHGTIPNWIWDNWQISLSYLNLSHNMFTDMQLNSYVIPSYRLVSLDVSVNMIQGQIPMPSIPSENHWITNDNQKILDYSNNRFSSVMLNFTAYISQTVYLKMSRNNIVGHIPDSVCSARNLKVLDLSHNNFTGVIPSCLIEDGSLAILNLRENNFKGRLPDNIKDQCNFETINLHGNNIEGHLSPSLSNCIKLEVLDIGDNRMVGTFPSWLGGMPNLRVLVLRSNKFYGSVGDIPGNDKFGEYFTRLQILDIASNNFTGNLKVKWFQRLRSMMANFNGGGQIIDHPASSYYYQDTVAITYKGQYVTFARILSTLTAIDFSNNGFEGTIPKSIGKLVSLHVLNMSHNAFTGNIPPQLGQISQLESLDLSWNFLSGEIPQQLTDLTFLETLDLCNNNLQGRIPQTRQFATFENNSYLGNTGLCGPPLSRKCDSSTQTNEVQQSNPLDNVDLALFLFIGLGFGAGFAVTILMKQVPLSKYYRIISILRRLA